MNMIESPEDMQRLANEWGFLPFFANAIEGFSIEENIDPRWWFSDDDDDSTAEEDTMGAWDWKGQCIIEGDLAYGKFFHGKAGYISMKYYPDFINYRRSRYKLAAQERKVLSTLEANHSLLSGELRRMSGYERRRYSRREANPLIRIAEENDKLPAAPRRKHGKEGFETAISKLQMGGRALIADFEYRYDKQGRRYGWGIARYATPEDFFGAERLLCQHTPQQSFDIMHAHLRQLLPQADEADILCVLG